MTAALRWAFGNWRVIAGLAGLLALLWAVATVRTALIEQGRDECRAAVERAIDQQQRIAEQNAAVYEADRVEREVEYRYRTREVIRHVPSDSACDWSPDAFRLLNDAITGGDPAGDSGGALSGPADYRVTHPAGDGTLDRDGGTPLSGLR